MSKRCVLSLVLLWLAIVSTSLAKKTSKKEFHFVQPQYAKAITERHRTNATVMHIRAIGAKGQVSYMIMDPSTPFEVDQRGHIWLMKKLNGNKKNIYQLNVKATDSANRNKPIYAEVRFDIMVKNHPPQFNNSDNKYICAVSENSRQVQILPPIGIIDQDEGTLGKLKRIKVIPEEGIPFKFVVGSNGSIEVKVTQDLDAEKESMFLFNIVAIDGGEKESRKADVFCKVVDANEFSPVFESSVYIGEVLRGKVYHNILQINAKDKDIGDEFGKICKYDIITKDVPFSINEEGILHLEKPLDKNAPEYCTFQVEAIDCGGKRSVVPTNITVYIKDICKIELKKPAFQDITIPQCIGQALVGPDVSIVHNKHCEQRMDLSFTATVHLETNAGLGCDRQKYDASSMYKLCGSSDFIDILPTPTYGKTWTSHLKTDGDAFIFDDKTTPVAVPKEAIPGDFGDHFTVSTWIKAERKSGKQIIMANTDKQTHNRIHFALIKTSRYFTIVHRLEPGRGSIDDYCNSDFHYKPHMFDNKWHHLAVVVDGCSVKLYVDGQHQSAKTVDYNYRMHKSIISAGLYVGAHWLGREHTFAQYFKGKLAGMAIKLNRPVSQQAIRCLVGCREHININVPMPVGFRSELVGLKNTMKIRGVGSPKDFEFVLQNIVYKNELSTPTEGKRKIRVTVNEKKTKLKEEFMVNVRMEKNVKPIITVRGCKDERVMKNRLREMGVPLCNNLKIDYQGCPDVMNSPVNTVKFLDMAVIKVSPPFKKGESLKLPKQIGSKKSIVDDLELESHSDENGLTICGAANYKLYEQLLREIVYENLNPDDNLHHDFSIKVSDQNKRYSSDEEKLHLSVLVEKPHQKVINLSKHRPFDLQADTLSAEELPGAVTVEKVAVKNTISTGLLAAIVVCTVSVFVFLIVLGIYRFRRNANVLEVEATAGEKEEMYWDDTGLGGVRITVNPLQKFQELDLNEDKESENNSDDEDNQEAKQSLEWDEGAL